MTISHEKLLFKMEFVFITTNDENWFLLVVNLFGCDAHLFIYISSNFRCYASFT